MVTVTGLFPPFWKKIQGSFVHEKDDECNLLNQPTSYVDDMIYDILTLKKKTIFYNGFKNENASQLLRAPLKKNFTKGYEIRVLSSVINQDLQERNREQFSLVCVGYSISWKSREISLRETSKKYF